MERARVRRAVAEADHRDAVEPLALRRHRQPNADRRSGADDARREHHALVGFGDVHGAALTAAGADDAAHHLAVDLFQRNAFADQVVQPAVGRHQLVVVAQRDPHRRGDGFLPARRPVHAHELAGADALGQTVVGRLHQHHQRVDAPLNVSRVGQGPYDPISRYTRGIGWRFHGEECRATDILPLVPSSPSRTHGRIEVVAVKLVDRDEGTFAVGRRKATRGNDPVDRA